MNSKTRKRKSDGKAATRNPKKSLLKEVKPFGKEWEAQLLKLPKKAIIDVLRKAGQGQVEHKLAVEKVFHPGDRLTFVDQKGEIQTTTFGELYSCMLELGKKPIPDIPKMVIGPQTEGHETMRPQSFQKTVHDVSYDLYEKRLNDANNCLAQQGSDGNWNVDEYMRGMFNGMELIVSIFEGREPKYRNATKNEVNARTTSPADLIKNFLREFDGYEDMIPTAITDITQILLNRLRVQAEVQAEKNAVTRKRFEDAVQTIEQLNRNIPGKSNH